MIYVFFAEGFEEAEALIPVDVLRRGGVEVRTVGVGTKTVCGAHGIPVVCDLTTADVSFDGLEGMILPGGMPGTLNLEKDADVQRTIDYCVNASLFVGAICAAPSILGQKGLLNGKRATCFPGFEETLTGAQPLDIPAVTDGKFITGQGAGAAFAFGFAYLAAMRGQNAADELARAMKYPLT